MVVFIGRAMAKKRRRAQGASELVLLAGYEQNAERNVGTGLQGSPCKDLQLLRPERRLQ